MTQHRIDLTRPYPEIKPGDRIVGIYSFDGIVQEVTVERDRLLADTARELRDIAARLELEARA